MCPFADTDWGLRRMESILFYSSHRPGNSGNLYKIERGYFMLAVHVAIQVKPECVEPFIEATRMNAENSLKEAGIARFDFVQQQDDPTRFMLVEIYRDEEAALRHKETAHYARWRDTVADMMAVPRSSIKYTTLYPDEAEWRCS
ncbi:MAG: (4S)-4-hydroxy-5-phosphonooxypentane-2,3-dione isomerase [Verrucomicrobiota bacterium]|jgi:quinol monooxygenase YgiN|nr:(4S)-4-hydroxy-5-phosphonooxypentane-2,3-dione isomerase [Verrucomicrobiota bacterium]